MWQYTIFLFEFWFIWQQNSQTLRFLMEVILGIQWINLTLFHKKYTFKESFLMSDKYFYVINIIFFYYNFCIV